MREAGVDDPDFSQKSFFDHTAALMNHLGAGIAVRNTHDSVLFPGQLQKLPGLFCRKA